MNDLIDTKQIELHFEAANEAAEKSSKMVRGAVIEAIEAGEQLSRAKECVPHGEWAMWLGKHWNYSQSLAVRYMHISNSDCCANLKEAKSINEALRMIADDKEEKTAPRSERKTGQVEVVEPDEPDDDPTPEPPTQRKTAKGSEKTSEDKKPKTAPITPEIIDEPEESFPEERTLSDFTEQQILDFLVATADEPKLRAKRLRKAADRIDPPTKFAPPDLEEVTAYFAEINCDLSPQYFIDFYGKGGWMISKGKPMKDWKMAARNANTSWDRNKGNTGRGKSGTARVPAPPRKPVVYHE